MDLVDYILNLAGVLLWLSWRGMRMDSEERAASVSLAGTLQRTEARARRGASLLFLLGLLLIGRAVVYRLLAPASSWTPRLDLHVVVPAFQDESLASLLTYSLLSFLRLLSTTYFWMLVMVMVNRRTGEGNRFQKIMRRHLGPAGRWPWFVQLVLPLFMVTTLWLALAPLLALLGVTSRVPALVPLLQQGLLIGGVLYLSLKYILPALLLAHLVINYVYFGRSSLCDFINLTAGNLLAPIRWVPLKVGRVNFAPLVGAAVILLCLHVLPIHLIPLAERTWQVRLHPLWPM